MRCVVINDFQGVAGQFADWSQLADVDLVSVREHPASEDALIDLLRQAEIAITLRERVRFTRRVFERLPRLQLLVATGMRNSAIDMSAAREHGVVVSGTGSSPTPPTELTWALILALSRNLIAEHQQLQAGLWQTTVGRDLYGRTLGVIGLGTIGSAVARVGLAFGMDVVAWSPNLTSERAGDVGVRHADSLGGLLEGSDVVTIHLKLGERSRRLIGREQLAAMKPDAVLINTSRSAIIDHPALIEALQTRTIGSAGLDVHDIEPLPLDHPIRAAPRALLTPHLGYVTEANYRSYFTEALEDIAAFLDGTPVRVLN